MVNVLRSHNEGQLGGGAKESFYLHLATLDAFDGQKPWHGFISF